MEKNTKSIQELDLMPLDENQLNQIKGGKNWDDKRHHRPGSGVASLSNTNDKESLF